MNVAKLLQLQRQSKRRYGYSEARIRAEELNGVTRRKYWKRGKKPYKEPPKID